MTEPSMLAGRYRLGRLLGRGGMGAVFEAHDDTLDRDIAVKLLELRGAADEGPAIERFRREAKILAGLSHPNIVMVYDFGIDAGRAWLVMQLLPGPTLQQLVERRGRLPVDAAERYTREAAAALAAAHAAGIVHRDIKPGNLMLAPDGSCTLVDLGIARLASDTQTEGALTQPGTILGTVQYVAPEVVVGNAPGPAADVYALGVVLYVMLLGRPPFDGADMVATMGQHVHATVPSLQAQRPDVAPGLDQLCLAMLAKDPAQRPTAAQVAAALGDTAVRPVAAAAAATVAMGVPPAGAGTVGLPPPRPPVVDPTGSSPESNGRSRTGLIAAGLLLVIAAAALIGWLLVQNAGSPTAANSTPPTTTTTSSHPPSPTSSQPSTTATTPNPSNTSSAPSTPESPTNTDSSNSSSGPDQGQVQQDLSNVHDAVTNALASLPRSDQNKLQHAYDSLAAAVNSGNTGDATSSLDDFDSTVSDLHDSGSLDDTDYSALTNASGQLRNALNGSSGG